MSTCGLKHALPEGGDGQHWAWEILPQLVRDLPKEDDFTAKVNFQVTKLVSCVMV